MQKLEESQNKEQRLRPAVSGGDYAKAQGTRFYARASTANVLTYLRLILSVTKSTVTRSFDYIYRGPSVTIFLKLTA